MAKYQEEVVATNREGVAADGTVVQQRTRAVESSVGPQAMLVNLVWYLYGLIATLLALRFIMKLAGANSSNGFVHFIYSITNWLSSPFDSIFNVTSTSTDTVTSVFEPSIIVAIVVYGLVAWGIVKLLEINQPRVGV